MSVVLLVHLVAALSSVVLVIGTVRARRLPPRARNRLERVQDVWLGAFLAGGPGRVADAAIAGMHADGRLAIGGPGVISVRQPVSHHRVEAAVLQAIEQTPSGALTTVRAKVMRSQAVQDFGDRLDRRGLLRHPRRGRPWRRMAVVQLVSCVAVVLLALLLTLTDAFHVGTGSVPFVVTVLPAGVLGAVVALVCRSGLRGRITPAGVTALRFFRNGNRSRVRRLTAEGGMGDARNAARNAALLVALGGTAVLTDELLRDHLTEAQRTLSGASAGASSSSSFGISPSLAVGSSTDVSDGDVRGDDDFSWTGDDSVSWCGASDSGSGSGCGSSSCGGGSSCGSSGSGCPSSSSGCSSSSSSCGSSSSSSSCGSSSSSSSCSSSSCGGSSCGS
ncbi:TIGR04222 domain-containing membrane protein [Streptomyces sp. NPDC003077]|uniref:TIGR04222 domain-containing membrane protein n=1 Tax=Streptomyces sp. NPDC003077 TaxID=3154443 RepID=UPI0033AAD986